MASVFKNKSLSLLFKIFTFIFLTLFKDQLEFKANKELLYSSEDDQETSDSSEETNNLIKDIDLFFDLISLVTIFTYKNFLFEI
jgi:hypothetical protein